MLNGMGTNLNCREVEFILGSVLFDFCHCVLGIFCVYSFAVSSYPFDCLHLLQFFYLKVHCVIALLFSFSQYHNIIVSFRTLKKEASHKEKSHGHKWNDAFFMT